MLTLKDILPYIHESNEIHIWFEKENGELIFNNKCEICDFWKKYEIVDNGIESIGAEITAITIQLPEEQDQ